MVTCEHVFILKKIKQTDSEKLPFHNSSSHEALTLVDSSIMLLQRSLMHHRHFSFCVCVATDGKDWSCRAICFQVKTKNTMLQLHPSINGQQSCAKNKTA